MCPFQGIYAGIRYFMSDYVKYAVSIVTFHHNLLRLPHLELVSSGGMHFLANLHAF